MKKIFLLIAIISVLFLAGCNTKQNVNNDVVENDENQEEIVNNSGESGNGEQEKNTQLDLTQSISIAELLLKNKLEIPNNKEEFEFDLGEIKIGNNSGNLSILVKEQPAIKFNENIIHEYRTNLEDATLVIFKDYIVCTDSYDFSGGSVFVYNENAEKVHEFNVNHDKIKVKEDVLLYSVYQGKLVETSQDGFTSTYARGDFELREEEGIFNERLINVDETDLYNSTNMY